MDRRVAPLRWGSYGELRAQIEKCSQVFSELYLSGQPFGPKETNVCHELSSRSCYTLKKLSC